MAKEASIILLFLSFILVFCSGTLVGFSFAESEDTESPTFIQRNKIYHITVDGFAQKEEILFPLSQREKELSKVYTRRILDETNNTPSPVNPTNPTSDTPAIITVPSSTPVTVSPTNPTTSVPITVPSSIPPPSTPTNPANSPVPVTNPAASYPPPSGIVPVTNNQPPPATSTNAPPATQGQGQGQSWCVAKSGVSATALQSALDYACGMPGVDCSQLQQGGSCYNPNSVQNHASFAFNSYYQKNPAPTSCDFGGTATLVNTNPSTGSCIYPSSSSSSSSLTGAGTSGSASSPSGLGLLSPPDGDSSHSAGVRPFLGCMVLAITLVTRTLILNQ
nr:probable glucan endo-1,3-beta-glucosidase A6 isoform X2 [Arachis hypogaea]